MKLKKLKIYAVMIGFLFVFGSQFFWGAPVSQYVHHDLQVSVTPATHVIQVKDRIQMPQSLLEEAKTRGNRIYFLLHGNLQILSPSENISIVEITDEKEKDQFKDDFAGINTANFEIEKKIPLKYYAIQLLKTPSVGDINNVFTIEYRGNIHHPIQQSGAEYARGFSETPGIVDEEGVYLAGATFWIPWFNDQLVTFHLESSAPEPYKTVSQGRRVTQDTKDQQYTSVWDSPEPMDEVYLLAGKFQEYGLKVGKVDIMAFLRAPDESLAEKYLETTGQYLEMYEKLIGPFPYAKFALIENFWETGYGMPSFTLLGPKVIRFPFILHSSYPHELLHNWWGNSVFVDYEAGNWCEGLTVFLADHLIKEQRGQGIDYRKTTLQGYTHYAADKKEEFPLTQFKARYDSLSSAIGYGKSMMLFRMLQLEVGDAPFKKAIQHFYKDNLYKRATFDHIRQSFETITGKDLKAFFQQWVTRKGAPELRLTSPSLVRNGTEYVVRFSLEQVQKEEPYRLKVPVALTLAEEKEAVVKMIDMTDREQQYQFSFNKQPLAIDVEPRFDVFRKLHNNEIPATLSSAFGAREVIIILPEKEDPEILKGYRALAESWAKESSGKIEIKKDTELTSLPSDQAVWLFGWNNRYKTAVENGIKGFPANLDDSGMTILKRKLRVDANSIIVAVKNENNPGQVVVLLSTDRSRAIPGLGRKLPHYGKYSFLAFEGDEPANTFKGQWPAVGSPLSADLKLTGLENKSNQTEPTLSSIIHGKVPNTEPLARLAPLFSSERLMKHVKILASEEMEGRGIGSQGIEKAGDYIEELFKNSGLLPLPGLNHYSRKWQAELGNPKKSFQLRNIIGMIPGKNPAFKDEAVVIAAHYDHLGLGWPDVHKGDEGKIHFGADDNASGMAVLLELAHTLGKSLKPERTILFVAFTAEECGLVGSAYFVEQLKSGHLSPFKTITAMVNLDTVGRLNEKGKLMVIGGASAREWRFIFMGIGYTAGIECQMVTQELDASDQVSFIKAGIPGIQLFSGPHADYHRPGDTVEKIDDAGLVKVATVAKETIVYLSERKEPLNFQGTDNETGKAQSKATSPKKPSSSGDRKVRTGIMPDFAFSGKGVKIGFVSPGSPAEKARLVKGDVIIKLNNQPVENLKSYSERLKEHKPGDQVRFSYMRDNKEKTTTITLTER